MQYIVAKNAKYIKLNQGEYTMKMKLIMESFKRSIKENFNNTPVVNSRKYTIDGIDTQEDEHEDGSISIYQYVEETGDMEFAGIYNSRAHLDSTNITKKLAPLLDREIEDINQAASLIQSLSDSEDKVMQIAVEELKDEAQRRISSLEKEKNSIEDLFDQYGGRETDEFGYGEDDDLEKTVYVNSGKATKELESIERRIEALGEIIQ